MTRDERARFERLEARVSELEARLGPKMTPERRAEIRAEVDLERALSNPPTMKAMTGLHEANFGDRSNETSGAAIISAALLAELECDPDDGRFFDAFNARFQAHIDAQRPLRYFFQVARRRGFAAALAGLFRRRP